MNLNEFLEYAPILQRRLQQYEKQMGDLRGHMREILSTLNLVMKEAEIAAQRGLISEFEKTQGSRGDC